MFQRIKGSIDRVIAEEQARQKTVSEQGDAARRSSSISRSNSGASGAARKPRPKKPGQDASKNDDGAANPDPSVFEAAFVIDDDEPSRAATPRPPTTDENSPQNGDSKDDGAASGKGDTGLASSKEPEKNGDDEGRSEGDKPVPPPKPAAAPEVSPEVRARLRKLEKLEATYPGEFTVEWCLRHDPSS